MRGTSQTSFQMESGKSLDFLFEVTSTFITAAKNHTSDLDFGWYFEGVDLETRLDMTQIDTNSTFSKILHTIWFVISIEEVIMGKIGARNQ